MLTFYDEGEGGPSKKGFSMIRGEGGSQKVIFDDQGGRGGQPKSDFQ